MEMDLDSETPPSSPVFGYSAITPLNNFSINECSFECKGSIHASDPSFSLHGLLATGDLISAIKIINKNSSFNESLDTETENTCYKFFNHTFEPTYEMLKNFIFICRKNIGVLENLVHSSGYSAHGHGLDSLLNGGGGVDSCETHNFKPWDLRRDVCNFINFVLKYSNSIRQVGIDSLLSLFDGMRKSIGSIEDWPSVLKSHAGSSDGNKCSSAYYHYFHLHLELRWFFLILSGEGLSHLDWILDDLIHLAWFKYTSEKSNDWNSKVGTFVAFNCYCVKELWTMIRHLVDEFKPQGKDFWDSVTTALNRFEKHGNDLLFPLWLVVNLAPLGKYSMQGQLSSVTMDELSSNCYHFVQEIVKESLLKSKNVLDVMNLTFGLLPHWGTDEKLAGALWDYWSTKIDKNNGVLDCTYWKSPEKWVSLVKSLTADNFQDCSPFGNDVDHILKSDLFLSFIRLFCGHVRFCSQDSKKQQRLIMKIYIKLSNPKIFAMSENGLIRLGTLHLATLSAATTVDDVLTISKRFYNSYHDIYEEFSKKGKPSSVRTILTTQAAMFLLMLDKGVNVEPVAATFVEQIKNLMLRESRVQVVSKKDLIMLYMEFLDLLPKYSGDSDSNSVSDLGQASLFCAHIKTWLSSAGPDYLNRTLRVCHNLLSWLILNGNESSKFTQAIVECTKRVVSEAVSKKYIKSSAMDLEPLADLAVDFTNIARQEKGPEMGNLFNHYALEVRTCPEISNLYLDKILNSNFPLLIEDKDLKLMQAWIRLICVGEIVPSKLTTYVLHCDDGLYGYSNDSLLEILCEKISEDDDYDRVRVERLLQPLVNLCEWRPLKENLKLIEATVRASAIILSKLKFMKFFSPKLPCVAKTIINFFISLLSFSIEGSDKILEVYLPQFFDAITAFPPWEDDSYLRSQVQQFVTASFIGFSKDVYLRNFTNHPCYRIMKSAGEKHTTYVLEEILSDLKAVANDQRLNSHTEYLQTLSGFTKRDVGLISIVSYSVPTVFRIVRLSGNTKDIITCADILSRLFDLALVSKCDASMPVLEEKFKQALEKEIDQNLSLHARKYFRLFQCMVSSKNQCRSEIRRFFKEEFVPWVTDQIHFCEVRVGSGRNSSLRNELQLLKAELERNV